MNQYRNIQLISNLPFSVNPIVDITDQLPSLTPDPETPRTPDKITYISVHHSGVEGGSPQSYANYHVNTRKWAHIGYHVVIEGDKIYQTNDLMTFSYHTSSNNHYTVSVTVGGDFTKRALTDAERNSLYAVILTYMDLFKIPVENVLGHQEFPDNQTDCPGFSMQRVRDDIKTLQMKMKRADTPAARRERAFAVANQATYMYNLSQKNDGDGEWALTWLDQVYDIMKSQNLL